MNGGLYHGWRLSNGQYFVVWSDEGAVSIKVVIDKDKETMWTTQKTMAELFKVSKSTISEHLKHIFEEGELN